MLRYRTGSQGPGPELFLCTNNTSSYSFRRWAFTGPRVLKGFEADGVEDYKHDAGFVGGDKFTSCDDIGSFPLWVKEFPPMVFKAGDQLDLESLAAFTDCSPHKSEEDRSP